MRFDSSVCSDLSLAYRKEWLETNGLGGFASSTIVGINTRRYHGLLVAALRAPVGRVVLLSKFEETLQVGDRRYDFSANQYPGVIHPKGHLWQTEFLLNPLPTFRYKIADIVLEKTIFMLRGQHSTALSYKILEGPYENIGLEIRPLIAFRNYHSLIRENPFINREVLEGEGWAAVRPNSDLPALVFNHTGGKVLSWANWFYNFEYEEERQRGLDWQEDLFCPFALRFDLSRGTAHIIASTDICDAGRLEEFKSAEIERRADLLQGWEQADDLVQDLVGAADQFIVPRERNSTILAGYHWFTDWGRDAMISLPGLSLIPGRYEDAKRILLAFAQYCNRGLLPNRFPDAGEEPEYNTVDATLWFFQAVYALVQRTGDYTFVHGRLYEQILNIIRWHIDGTRFNIKVDADGLLRSGEPGVQLTWMDVKIGGEVITPRIGKPVEVQALWYNALRIVEELARQMGDQKMEDLHRRMAARARRSFNQQFWNDETRCLYDCIDGELRDASIRPNQILAASLPFSMLSKERMKEVLEVVTQKLLTPYGLRSLSPDDPKYHGTYGTDTTSRERAYHEGTVWAWLMGPYITAAVRAAGGTQRARKAAAVLLDGFRRHMSDAGLGFISEIFDGDPPHAPRGCIAQAWSVAEVLRVAVDDLHIHLPLTTDN